jgi:hypothetical protein
MDGEEGTTKYAKGAKRQAKLMFSLWVHFGHYSKLEHERFINQALSRISRIS